MRVLLVDHDSDAIENITRAIRGVLELDCVTSKGDALLLLRQNTYDVLIACERCVDGSGLDLLGRTTRTTAPLKRIFAAAPERLQLLGPRLAPFKVQRTINYPIDLEELWLAIAQVTSGPNDETDGTIERVVLDERGIPASGSVPRAPIPQRPLAPLSAVSAATAPVITAAGGRAATARLAQPAPEPPLHAPPPPRQPPPAVRAPAPPRTASDTGRMLKPRMPPTPAPAPPPMTANGPGDFGAWIPEAPADEDFQEIAAQARFGVRQKVVDEAARRKRMRLFAAGGIAIVVAGAIVLLIEKFYDPAARARKEAIAAQVQQMAEQQKVTDDLTIIEMDIENAIMANDFATARKELADLVEKAPNHPRRDFLEKSIDRAEELARLSPQNAAKTPAVAEAPAAPAKPRLVERAPERAAERPVTHAPERSSSTHGTVTAATPGPRTYGAPVGEAPRQPIIPLDAPINAPPTLSARRPDSSFSGRTVEAGDAGSGRAATPEPAARTPQNSASVSTATASGAGSAVPPAASAAPAAAVDVVPAKILKRVTPIAPADIPRKTKGYVIVRFSIGADGRVSDLAVIESQPQGVFDQAAQDAVRKWTYEPRKENGVAVESTAKAKLVFDQAN
jgi:TonB family protein